MLTAMDLRVQLSSCVPATALETSGARLEADDLLPLADHPKVLGLAEFMNFPGVLARDPSCLAKLAAFQTRPIDGHSPLVRRPRAQRLSERGRSAPTTRSPTLPEAQEKLAKGMQLLIREGSVCKDLHALAPIITERNSPFIAFCTDDRNPLDIAEEGHLDFMIRTAIGLGAPPLAAYRAATHLGRAHLRPARPRPGRARLARRSRRHRRPRALRGLDDACAAGAWWTKRCSRRALRSRRSGARASRRGGSRPADFVARGQGPSTQAIGVIPGKIITERVPVTLPFRNGERGVDLGQDVVKVSVVARHGVNDNLATAFVKGFGMKRGRDRFVRRPRQPQPMRRRRRRGRHGGGGQPLARDRGRVRGRARRQGGRGTARCRSPAS